MKKLTIPVICSLLIGLSACSDKIDIAAPYKNVIVVNGILDMNDTAHYIRIEKAFMDQNKSAVTMAKEPDSSYFKNLKVELIEYEPSTGKTINTMPLYRVNLDNEGYPKESATGDFFNTPNYAYKVQVPATPGYKFNPFYQYSLHVENVETGNIDSSEFIRVVNSDTTDKDGDFSIPNFKSARLPVDFARTISSSYTYDIRGKFPLNSKIMEGHLIFHYIDSNVVAGTSTKKSIDYLFATDVRADDKQIPFELKVENSAIYRYLLDEMGPAPSNVSRYLDSCDILILAGSTELFTYQQVFDGQKGGLTGDQVKPNYTNMKGGDVLGVLGSRTSRFYMNAGIDEVTLDSIVKSPFMQPLSIKGRTSY